MNTRSKILGSLVSAITFVIVFSVPGVCGAQGRGGANIRSIVAPQSRLVAMEKGFELTKEQKNSVKTLMDAAHKEALPIREGLAKTHAAIAAAVQAGKPQAEIDAASKAYGEQAAAMAGAEMKAMADIMKLLTDQQREKTAAVSAMFFNMRGAFLDNKKWDDVPEARVRY